MKFIKIFLATLLLINIFACVSAQPEVQRPQGSEMQRSAGVVTGTIVDENSIPLQ